MLEKLKQLFKKLTHSYPCKVYDIRGTHYRVSFNVKGDLRIGIPRKAGLNANTWIKRCKAIANNTNNTNTDFPLTLRGSVRKPTDAFILFSGQHKLPKLRIYKDSNYCQLIKG